MSSRSFKVFQARKEQRETIKAATEPWISVSGKLKEIWPGLAI